MAVIAKTVCFALVLVALVAQAEATHYKEFNKGSKYGKWHPKDWHDDHYSHGKPYHSKPEEGTPPPKPLSDVDILNFALNLEYLEAEFYSYSCFGYGLPKELSGGGPPSTGGKKAKLGPKTQALCNNIARDEIKHVAFLRTALGDKAVPRPLINLKESFAAAADAAFGKPVEPKFSPYVNDIFWLHGAFIFEDVGVTAYKGAAPLITDKGYLEAAAGILAVEANHAGAIRAELIRVKNFFVEAYGVEVKDIVAAISKLRATLSGADDDQGIVGPGPKDVIVSPSDKNAVAFSRTPRQVLNIVYGKADADKGLFFPEGISA